MQNDRYENLEELLGGFMGSAQAKDAAREIAEGERIFKRYPGPGANQALVAGI